MPPIALPRRMWASGEMRFIAPLIVGEDVERVSTIAAIEAKHGRSGPLVFLTIEHVYRQAGEARLHETQRIVYREDPRPGEPAPPDPPAPEGTPRRTLRPDPVQLFRYSALTFNGHRIHYDQAYAREVEGYPDIVVHGPLIATLLLQACADAAPGEEIATFSFRARSPTYAGRPLELHAGRAGHRLEAFAASEGRLVMSAEASLRGEARAIA